MAGKNSRASNRETHEVDQALFTAPGSVRSHDSQLSTPSELEFSCRSSMRCWHLEGSSPRTELIAGGLEVSHITARRALESLVAEGVLVRRRGRGGGTFVADDPPTLDDSSVTAYRADEQAILRLIDQRSLMESAIVAAAALRATAAQCDELEDLIRQSKNARLA